MRASRKVCSWKLRCSRFAPGPKTRKKEHPPSLRSARQSSRDANAQKLHHRFEIHSQKRKEGDLMSDENIFSGLKVVDLASFIAGPGAATILSDFGADVIKVEPPEGELWRIGQKIPPQPRSEEPYPFQLANRNKRGVALNLKAASAQQVLERLAKWADV